MYAHFGSEGSVIEVINAHTDITTYPVRSMKLDREFKEVKESQQMSL